MLAPAAPAGALLVAAIAVGAMVAWAPTELSITVVVVLMPAHPSALLVPRQRSAQATSTVTLVGLVTMS